MKLFWIDHQRKIEKSYQDLIDDLNKKRELNRIISFEDPYKIYLEFLAGLVSGKSIELLDKKIHYKSRLTSKINIQHFSNIDDIISNIENERRDWKLNLYTSGTTGQPRKVTHKLINLTRAVKRSPDYIDQIWALAYNPTHIAGILVFIQAFLNKNTIVYLFETKSSALGKMISKYKITHISATPSFYRMFLGVNKIRLNAVVQVTVGGERFDESLNKGLRQVFPGAKITNIYATTETGSILKSSGPNFLIPEDYRKQIMISKNNELMIHHSLLGEMHHKNLTNGWYNTHDIVEWINKKEFIIVSRKDDVINVGGYKVNPLNVESDIKKIPGIIDVKVTARNNRITGNILQANIVKKKGEVDDKLEERILKRLENSRPYWEIPRIIKFVSKIELTRTFKVSRQ